MNFLPMQIQGLARRRLLCWKYSKQDPYLQLACIPQCYSIMRRCSMLLSWHGVAWHGNIPSCHGRSSAYACRTSWPARSAAGASFESCNDFQARSLQAQSLRSAANMSNSMSNYHAIYSSPHAHNDHVHLFMAAKKPKRFWPGGLQQEFKLRISGKAIEAMKWQPLH